MKKIILVLFISLLLVGCSNDKIDGKTLYKTIDGTLAQEFVNNDKAILIDVRTIEEYENVHIEGAINIPFDNINEESIGMVTDSKIDNIIVYCQSGNRSKEASIKIIELGYTNVYDLGSINNWEIIKNEE